MKVVLLAGGFGTRLSEETTLRPKPMVEIGGKPILWHIMKIYAAHGYTDFVVCLGYKGYFIKEYFSNYFLHQSNVTFDFENNSTTIHNSSAEPWKVTLVDTGLHTMTGGRIEAVRQYLGDEPFLLTYGDGVGSVDISASVKHHKESNCAVTVTAVQPSGRFGALDIDDSNKVSSFLEKPKGDGSWINGGFFVCEPKVFDYINGPSTIFEKAPLEELAKDGLLSSFKHTGFWKPMDTLRDRQELERLCDKGDAPWKVW